MKRGHEEYVYASIRRDEGSLLGVSDTASAEAEGEMMYRPLRQDVRIILRRRWLCAAVPAAGAVHIPRPVPWSECADDQCLYAEIMSLLRPHGAESLLDHGAESMAGDWLLTTTHELRVGTRIGPYEISSEIGRGGMGTVYRAKDTRLDRDVALKFVWEAGIGSSELFPHFDREVRAVSALNHPNIITIHDIGSADGLPYIACEFVDGVTLRERLSAGRMDLDEVLHVGLQMAEALAVAHAAGIVHRDIKPENVMIRRDGLVKVLDFGIAILTRAGAGTGARSDVYSLGLVLCEMATGQRPGSGFHCAPSRNHEQCSGYYFPEG